MEYLSTDLHICISIYAFFDGSKYFSQFLSINLEIITDSVSFVTIINFLFARLLSSMMRFLFDVFFRYEDDSFVSFKNNKNISMHSRTSREIFCQFMNGSSNTIHSYTPSPLGWQYSFYLFLDISYNILELLIPLLKKYIDGILLHQIIMHQFFFSLTTFSSRIICARTGHLNFAPLCF